MPSKLATTTANQLAGMVALRAKAASIAPAIQTITIRGPFTGLTPDVDPNLLDGTSFNDLQNVLARSHGEAHGEVMGLPDGYRQLNAANLPLGDGATLPADAGDEMPIVRLDQILRWSPTGSSDPGEFAGEFILTPIAVTAGDGTNPDTGNMYRIDATGVWVQIPPSVSMTAAGFQLSADRDGRTTSKSMPDSCIAPFGATARAANSSGNDDLQSGPIQEPCLIYCNDVNEVMVFPSSTTETTAVAPVHGYEPLCDDTSSPALDGGDGLGFKAKSCETWNGRVYFLNTSEAGTRRVNRLRRTAKFTADPDPTIVGAGFYDFTDFQGEGLRIETLGEVLAVYFSDGVAFMRPTGVPTSPDEPQIIDTARGLLGTHALCSIGRNVHFGVFTDGWWLLDQSGRWQEVGVQNIEGKQVPKWRTSFYEELPPGQRHRLYCYYDQPNNLVYIAYPTIENPEPEKVWIWDPTSDRVFIENYPVTCFGTFTPALQSGTQIDNLVGTIDDQNVAIDSFAPIAGFPKARVHGDLSGFVYVHHPELDGYDSATNPPTPQDPAWSFSMGLRSPAGFRNLSTVDRVSLEYFNHDNLANVSIEVYGPSADGSQARSVRLNGGNHEDIRVRDAWFRYTAQNVGLSVSGSGTFHIRSLAVDLWPDALEPRGL